MGKAASNRIRFPLILNLLKDGNAASNRIWFPLILNLLKDGNTVSLNNQSHPFIIRPRRMALILSQTEALL